MLFALGLTKEIPGEKMPTEATTQKVGVLITARADSERLPQKYSEWVDDHYCLLDAVYFRAKKAGFPTFVVNPGDDVGSWCWRENIPTIDCPPDDRDVTRQLLEAATKEKLDIIVLVTGDCAFVDPKTIKDAVAEYLDKPDLKHCLLEYGPEVEGLSVRVFSRVTLRGVDNHLKLHREHGVSFLYLYQDTEKRYRRVYETVEISILNQGLRMCVDYPEDLERVRAIYDKVAWDASWWEALECAYEIETSPVTPSTSSQRSAVTTVDPRQSPYG